MPMPAPTEFVEPDTVALLPAPTRAPVRLAAASSSSGGSSDAGPNAAAIGGGVPVCVAIPRRASRLGILFLALLLDARRGTHAEGTQVAAGVMFIAVLLFLAFRMWTARHRLPPDEDSYREPVVARAAVIDIDGTAPEGEKAIEFMPLGEALAVPDVVLDALPPSPGGVEL